MQELHAANRNHVWAYYIRNMIRPAVIAEQKVDRIIGNPPWLTYGQSADIIRTELREMSDQRYQIWAGGRNSAPHQDIATVFYTRCAELYAKVGATIGMVLPHSALRTGPHLKWRIGSLQAKKRTERAKHRAEPSGSRTMGLRQLDSRLLPHAGQRRVCRNTKACVTVPRWRRQPSKCGAATGSTAMTTSAERAKRSTTTTASSSPLTPNCPAKSPRHRLTAGFSLSRPVPHTAMIPTEDTTNVKPRMGKQDNMHYEGQLNQLEGVVSNDNLFDVYLGECIAPYVALDPLKAVLPVQRPTMTMPLNHDNCEGNKHDACRLEVTEFHATMQRRWSNAAEMFREAHKNQVHQRPVQQPEPSQQADQPTGVPARCHRRRWNHPRRLHNIGQDSQLRRFIGNSSAIVESNLYQTICQSVGRSLFHDLPFINSNEFAEQESSRFAPTNWAKKIRHIHKHGWKLPIPRYDVE